MHGECRVPSCCKRNCKESISKQLDANEAAQRMEAVAGDLALTVFLSSFTLI